MGRRLRNMSPRQLDLLLRADADLPAITTFPPTLPKPAFARWPADPATWHAAYLPSDGHGNDGSTGMTAAAGPVGL
jgi:hypothetical protein